MTHLKLQKLQTTVFLHLYLQFYYVSVAVTLFRVRSTWYGERGQDNFWGAPVPQQPLPTLVLNLLLQLTTGQTVRTACTTSTDWNNGYLIAAYYSFIYSKSTTGSVGLIGWLRSSGRFTHITRECCHLVVSTEMYSVSQIFLLTPWGFLKLFSNGWEFLSTI